METRANRGNSLKTEVSMIVSWTLQLRMVGVLLATCGIGAQLGIQKCGIFKKSEDNLEASFNQENRRSLRAGKGSRDRQGAEKSEQCELDPEDTEEVWPEPSPEAVRNMAEGRMAPHGWRPN